MCICGGDTPNGFGATELWKLTRFGKRENKLNLGAHIFRSDYAIMTGLAPKWSPFHVLCDDLHIVGDTPYRFGVIQLWSWQNLGNVKIGFNVGAYIFQSDYAIITELAPKWSPFHVLCDDLNIVGDTPYRFGVTQLWSWLYYERRKIWVELNHPYLLNKDDSGGGTHTKMMHILYTFWWYQHCWWYPVQIWSYMALTSTMFLQYRNTQSCTCISLMKKTVVVGLTPKRCTFCVCSDEFTLSVISHTKFEVILLICCEIRE